MQRNLTVPGKVFHALSAFIDQHGDSEVGGKMVFSKDKRSIDGYLIQTKLSMKDKSNRKPFIILDDDCVTFHSHPSGGNVPSGKDLITLLKRHPIFLNEKSNACGHSECGLVVTDLGVWVMRVTPETLVKILHGLRENPNIRSANWKRVFDKTETTLTDLVVKFVNKNTNSQVLTAKHISMKRWSAFAVSYTAAALKLGFKLLLYPMETLKSSMFDLSDWLFDKSDHSWIPAEERTQLSKRICKDQTPVIQRHVEPNRKEKLTPVRKSKPKPLQQPSKKRKKNV